jgi:sec-independent protein translocase protein TatB
MDFLGIGPLELLLILVLAFLFFGPEKLPGIAAKAGRWYRNFRKTTSDLSQTISQELSAETELENPESATPESGKKVTRANSTAASITTKSDE